MGCPLPCGARAARMRPFCLHALCQVPLSLGCLAQDLPLMAALFAWLWCWGCLHIAGYALMHALSGIQNLLTPGNHHPGADVRRR